MLLAGIDWHALIDSARLSLKRELLNSTFLETVRAEPVEARSRNLRDAPVQRQNFKAPPFNKLKANSS